MKSVLEWDFAGKENYFSHRNCEHENRSHRTRAQRARCNHLIKRCRLPSNSSLTRFSYCYCPLHPTQPQVFIQPTRKYFIYGHSTCFPNGECGVHGRITEFQFWDLAIPFGIASRSDQNSRGRGRHCRFNILSGLPRTL
jgi:hypothetical protein